MGADHDVDVAGGQIGEDLLGLAGSVKREQSTHLDREPGIRSVNV